MTRHAATGERRREREVGEWCGYPACLARPWNIGCPAQYKCYQLTPHLGCQQLTEVSPLPPAPVRRVTRTRSLRRKTKFGFCACANCSPWSLAPCMKVRGSGNGIRYIPPWILNGNAHTDRGIPPRCSCTVAVFFCTAACCVLPRTAL
jgi:hypothetical protein